MPRLPDQDDLDARPIPQSRRGISSVRNAGAVGNAIEGIGAQVGRTAEIVQSVEEEKADREARLQAAQARSDFITQKIQLDSEFEHDQDFDTQEQRYTERVSAIGSETAAKIKSPFARTIFETELKPDVERSVAAVKEKIFAGRKDMGRASVLTTISNNGEAILAARTEEDRVALLSSTNTALAVARSSDYISAQEEATQRLAFTEKYAKGRLSLMGDEEQVATLASSLLATEAHPDGKTGTFVDFIPRDDRVALLRGAESRIRAEERAARAEQRLAIQEKVDAAEEVARLIDDGIPVPTEAIDSAIDVAKGAKKDALVYRLGVGKVKTALSVEYKAAVPQELQGDIDELSVRISRAGDHPKPEDVIARDHLVTMRDNATRILGSDPLEFAARAWGTNIPDIDWGNPASVVQRGKLATSIARRAGVPVAPLRGHEVELAKDEMGKGSGGKVAVMDRIRLFGPDVALAAAKQVAPSDAGFRTAVGISTWSRSAARDAIIGADALTGAPDLFKKDRAEKLYGEFVIPALRLLPDELRDGVFEASRNIYAAGMTRSGNTVWKEQAWWAGVNRTLGQYRDEKGVNRGGLIPHRGGLLLIPTGVSQQEFEHAFTKATPDLFTIAGNGKPVWGNGAPVKASEWGRLRLVADGDGTYRMTDGNGFISVKGGAPFRLDYRKYSRIVPQ